MAERIQVGTSGWHYAHWRGPFYPENLRSEEMLDFYARRLATVEINNSFYHLPSRETFRAWREGTPEGFTFAVKASRYITHMKKLKDPGPTLTKFFRNAEQLREKLGPVLFQLPPRWQRNAERLGEFLERLPGGHRYAFEFRDPIWFDEEIYAVLRRSGAALCVYDLAGVESPLELTANFGYIRLHGPSAQKYAGRYTRAQLRRWLKICEGWLDGGAKEIFVYFDNDQAGFAALNAIELRAMAGAGTAPLRTQGRGAIEERAGKSARAT